MNLNEILNNQELQKLSLANKRDRDARVHAIQELRRSSAAGVHADRRSRCSRTRGAAQRKAIKEFS